MTDRILWKRRPVDMFDGGDIDEIVLHGCDAHIEQMDDRSWWISLERSDGAYWMGNFVADARMRFTQQENNGIDWDREDTHEIHKIQSDTKP